MMSEVEHKLHLTVNAISHKTNTPKQTKDIGFILGKTLHGGEVIAITGDLGTGKTHFVQGIGQGLGLVSSEITSPTFALIHEHASLIPLFHIDLYRLESLAEVESIGLEEYFTRNGVIVIEWAERAMSLLPAKKIAVTILHEGGDKRKITITKNSDNQSETLK